MDAANSIYMSILMSRRESHWRRTLILLLKAAAKETYNSYRVSSLLHFEDAGFDIYARFDEEYMVIAPQETRIIPTGLISAFPTGYVVILKERRSAGTRGMGQRSGVIDSEYRGEWLVSITNKGHLSGLIPRTPGRNN